MDVIPDDIVRAQMAAASRVRSRHGPPARAGAKWDLATRVVSHALVVATGASIDGIREVLGTAVGDSESFEFWREFLGVLRGRGLSCVHLVVPHAHTRVGLKAAVTQQFSGASWQRCRVHFMRNLQGAVHSKHVPPVIAAVKTIFARTPTRPMSLHNGDQVTDTLTSSFLKIASPWTKYGR